MSEQGSPGSEAPGQAGILRTERLSYRGKHFLLPVFDPADPVILRADPARGWLEGLDDGSGGAGGPTAPLLRRLGRVWDLSGFAEPCRPVSLGLLSAAELAGFAAPGVARVLDLPIHFPGIEEYRLPRALAQVAPVIQRIIDAEARVFPELGPGGAHRWYAYLTVDQREVLPGTLQREAPCHVDGFQGARWHPRCRANHSYTVSDHLPTAYYVQPFDLGALDERVHDFFWEMNAQVADTAEAHRWQPAPGEITLMDAWCVHRGVEATTPVRRTWLRLSFEEERRVFDRLGNAHNPLFDYAWEMVERDIEHLHLRAFRADSDPSLRCFPWQDPGGAALPPGAPKTKPRLRPGGSEQP